MSKSVNKLLHKNHNTISDLTNTSKSILNAALDENKHSTEKLKTACVSLTSILDRLKFLRRYVSNVYIDKEKKKYRSIYHLFKENKIVKEISYDNIKELIENEDDYHLYDLNHHIWDRAAEVSKIPKNTCYSLWLNKNNNNAQITSEDDVKIIKCVKRIDDWIAFGSYMQKAPFLLFKRYKQFVQQIKRDLWIKIEDIKLTEAVNQYGAGKWTLIANYVGTKNPKQCMHRYRNKLVEGIRTGKWTLEEDSKLKEAVSIFGVGKWSRISEHVGTRNDSQCRERYCNILDPSIKKGKWSMEEDRQLLAIVIYVGEGNWSYISTKIHGRTDAQCRRRYKFLKKIK